MAATIHESTLPKTFLGTFWKGQGPWLALRLEKLLMGTTPLLFTSIPPQSYIFKEILCHAST